MKQTLLTLIAPSVILLGATTSHAALIASEDFSYPAGLLGTANGGTGWIGAYTSGPGTVAAASLTNGANPFTPTGGSLMVGGSQNPRQFSTTSLMARDSDATLYFSFMVRPTTIGTNPGNILQFKNTDLTFNHLDVGWNTAGQWAIGGGYGSGGGGTGTSAAAGSGTGAGAAFALAQSYFVIGKVVTSSTGNDQTFVQIYGNTGVVDTTDTLASNNLLNFSVNRTGTLGSQVISFNTSGGSAAGDVDGLRVGTDYASVAPIPEPSAALLGALGALALLRRRRA